MPFGYVNCVCCACVVRVCVRVCASVYVYVCGGVGGGGGQGGFLVSFFVIILNVTGTLMPLRMILFNGIFSLQDIKIAPNTQAFTC